MSDTYPKYYLSRDGFEGTTAYIVRQSNKSATCIVYQGQDIHFTWADLDDRLVQSGRWREVDSDEASREFSRLFEMHDSSPSIASIKVAVHGMEMRVGDFYFGNAPNVSGVWARFRDDPSIDFRPDYVGVIENNAIVVSDVETMWFWMYLGQMPKCGTCHRSPVELIPGCKYRLATTSSVLWIYRFSGEADSMESRRREIAHWFSSEDGNQVMPFRKNKIIEKID